MIWSAGVPSVVRGLRTGNREKRSWLTSATIFAVSSDAEEGVIAGRRFNACSDFVRMQCDATVNDSGEVGRK